MFGSRRIKKLEERVDALEREVVRLITAQKSDAVNARQETATMVSVADEEGEPWLTKIRNSQ